VRCGKVPVTLGGRSLARGSPPHREEDLSTLSGITRCLFHLADAPCHGVAYHEHGTHGGEDRWPEGDPLGRDLGTLLRQLKEVQGVDEYTFTHITGYTTKMLREFKKVSRPLSRRQVPFEQRSRRGEAHVGRDRGYCYPMEVCSVLVSLPHRLSRGGGHTAVTG